MEKEAWVVRCFICKMEAEVDLNIDPEYEPVYMGRTLPPFPIHESDGGTFLPVRPALCQATEV